MADFARIPVTVAVFAALAVLLSGCIAYDAASTVVDAGGTVVGAAGSAVGAVGDVVTSPFDGDDSDKKKVR
ncbi:MAG TPA: hypothetical protein VGC16_06600 [Rhizomicrobium sp.]